TLVAQQIALHRGGIRVLDRPTGAGTRVEVTLPLSDGTADTEDTLPLPRNWMITTADRPQEFHKDGS
ncbi:two-component sensor histidine kinase, partial [Streptomyces sp. NPDC057927]